MTGTLKEILFFRFDVSYYENLELLYKKLYNNYENFRSASKYFQNNLDKHIECIKSHQPVFLSSLFHSILGNMIVMNEFDDNVKSILIDYIESLLANGGGFFPTDPKYIIKFPKMKESRFNAMVPEIYSTYYGYFAELLLGHKFDDDTIKRLSEWIFSNVQPSGLIYSAQYSNTREEWRMESELTSQLFFSLSLLRHLNDAEIKKISTNTANWLIEHIPSMKTVTSKYFSLKSLELLLYPSPIKISQEIIQFLNERKSLSNDGYYDYLLSDKIDETMGSKSSIGLDKISTQIFSTYYATSIILKGIQSGSKNLQIDFEIIRNLEKTAHNLDGGFGKSIWIKEFAEPFGPTSAELETIMMILFPALTYTN